MRGVLGFSYQARVGIHSRASFESSAAPRPHIESNPNADSTKGMEYWLCESPVTVNARTSNTFGCALTGPSIVVVALRATRSDDAERSRASTSSSQKTRKTW